MLVAFEDDLVGHGEEVLLVINQILRSLAEFALRVAHELRSLWQAQSEGDRLLVVARRWQTALPKMIVVIGVKLLAHRSMSGAALAALSAREGVLRTRLAF